MTGHKPFTTLRARMAPAQQERARAKAARLREQMPLHELRAALELSQQHLAALLHVDQPAISRMERRADMMLSTLAKFIEAMGGTLELRATFAEGSVRIAGLADIRKATSKKRAVRRAERQHAST